MKVAVVMPTYNQDKYIHAALVSWERQKYPSHLVVVDDGSTDSTPQFLNEWEKMVLGVKDITIVSHTKNAGTAEAINTGVKMALLEDVDALTWISSDNVMHDDWLSTLVRELTMSEDIGVVYSGFTFCHSKGDRVLFRPHTPDHLINDVNCYYGPSFLIRTEVWIGAGHHRGKISHDYDHWLRVEEYCFSHNLKIMGIPKPLCRYNAHDERVTVTRRDQFDAHVWQQEARKRRGL